MEKEKLSISVRNYIMEKSVRSLAERGITFRPLRYIDYNTPADPSGSERSQSGGIRFDIDSFKNAREQMNVGKEKIL